jgi:hypothetical protein
MVAIDLLYNFISGISCCSIAACRVSWSELGVVINRGSKIIIKIIPAGMISSKVIIFVLILNISFEARLVT